MWVRGLKRLQYARYYMLYSVAPHVGAWIETVFFFRLFLSRMPSHPMWVRGLKQASIHEGDAVWSVAPHVGAWIETHH